MAEDPTRAEDPNQAARVQEIFDILEARGEAKGEAKGMAKGKAKAVLTILSLRFGPLPPERIAEIKAQLVAAPSKVVDSVIAASLGAAALEEALAPLYASGNGTSTAS